MGQPTERENAPEPTAAEQARPGVVRAPEAAAPEAPADDAPYEPPVRAYEQQVLGTVRAPAGPPTGDPTQVLPVVRPSAGAPATRTPAVSPPADLAGSLHTSPAAGGPAFPATSTATAPPAPPSEPSLGAALGVEGDGAPSRLPKVAMWTGIGLVLAGGLYTGAQWVVADEVPRGTTVAGVEIGGRSAPAAVAAIEAGLGPRAAEPVTVTAGEASTTLDPAESGLALDAEGTVAGLTGFSMSPARLWDHLVGAESVRPRIDVDAAKLGAAIDKLQESLLVTPVDGTVKLVDGKAVATPAEDGTEVTPDEAADVITSGWLVEQGPFELPTRFVHPEIDQAETDAALAQAEKLVSGPVQVSVGGQQVELPAEALAQVASYKAVDGELRLELQGDGLVEAIVDRTVDLLRKPVDARFEFSGGKPVVVGGEPGTTLDAADVVAAVQQAATGDDRSAEIELVEQQPEDTREELEKLGVKEVVSSFSTPLTNEYIRTQNLIRGSELVTGTLIKPDEVFSLIDTLSPITIANGFHAAGVVSNGVHTEGVGGGLSQMATTTYNAGFFAGYDDVEHRQHSYWFTRYPPGREATIYVGSLDMRFRNDTPYGAVMQAWVGGGELHVQIWSTKYYEVRESAGEKRNIVPTTTEHRSGPDCENYPAGQAGFSITNYRKVYLDGKLVKDESYPWTYKPDNGVVCDAGGGGR